MKNLKFQYLTFCIVIITFFNCKNEFERNLYPEELTGGFELLRAEQTGVDFNNKINETPTFNHYFYSQMYVGSGVALGDLNNDGLLDVFFGGNQVTDRLYINKGGFQFDDITKKSKIAINPGWTWGVTMADVNADGYLDVYVSRNGVSSEPEERRNQLYINNKDLTFTESAIQYGLADVGFSTQAVFFDMDNDGDLDMYQVNQVADKKLLLINKIPPSQYKYFKDRLYRNENGQYVDVSTEVGISTDISYGLSVNATDFNNDGWTDLYVANDYAEPDFMYYNNGDGTFTNVINDKLKHITQLSMGSDTGDINNDGLIDLITTDMTPEDHYRSKTNMATMSTSAFNTMVKNGAHYQYMTNTLQINTGLGTFSDVANLSGISFTDWSWASLLVDLDNDGFKDIIISNGIKKDVDNNDYRAKVSELGKNATLNQLFELSKNTPSQKISNYAFKNKGDLKFEKITKEWGFDTPSFSNGMAYGDLDNDGDLDVVVNNIDDTAFIYKNKANGNFLKIEYNGPDNNKFGIGAKAKIEYNGILQVEENSVTRGFISSVAHGSFFGLGKETIVDKVEIIWTNGYKNIFENVNANSTITADFYQAKKVKNKTNKNSKFFTSIDPENLGVNYQHVENEFDEYIDEILLPHNISQNGPFIAAADVNGDGIKDFFVGGALGDSGTLYIKNNKGKYIKNSSQPWSNDSESEDLGCLFFDVDNDGDNDLYVASGGSEYKKGDNLLKDRLYINDGEGNFSKNDTALPNIFESTQTVKSSDIDNDGDLDLFVGVRVVPGKYAYPASSYLLINNNGKFIKDKNSVSLENIGMVTDAVFSDIDNDEDQDLIIVGEWMHINVLENKNGSFINATSNYDLDDTRGIWWSITASDLDNDGDDDYIIGNLGKNNKFKASEEHPFKVYANDFDNNGTNDIVLAKYYKDDYVPLRGRECTSQQMPYVAEKFKDYDSFASSKLIDILPQDKVDDAVVYDIKSFESIILINDNGKLKKKVLPIEAQISPVKSSLVLDVNKDGFKDIITIGNHYGVEVETTRYDAGYGSVLLGNGKNTFTSISALSSGFYVPKDSRSIVAIKEENNNLIIVSNNNDQLLFFRD